MGTRNLTVVIHKGEVRMAQYGQWDGYPNGVGNDIAKVLKKTSIKTLRKAIEKCTFLTADEILRRWEEMGATGDWITIDVSDKFAKKYPLLSRDNAGGEALRLILKNKNKFELKNMIDFAADSLFCEWAYVIDLDKERVEIYQGFNQQPLSKKDRFFSIQEKSHKEHRKDDQYYPIRLLKSYKYKDFTSDNISKLVRKLDKAEELAEVQ